MATDPNAQMPAFSTADQSVLIRGNVLRQLRQQAGLRLVDLGGERGAITRLSRLERRPAYRLPVPVLNDLLRAVELGVIFTSSDTWHAAIVSEVITWYTRGNLRAVRRTLTAFGLIVSTCPTNACLMAEIFAARSAEAQSPGRTADMMRDLSQRAERELVWPAAAWARLFESEAHEAHSDHKAALSVATGTIGIQKTPDSVLPLLCLATVAARSFLRCGRPEEGLSILEKVRVDASYPFAAAQMARAAAMIHEASGERMRAVACLKRAAEAAMAIPNPGLCAEIREDLASLYARAGRADAASTERLRAAAWYRRAGHLESALALIDAALGAG